MCVFDPRVAALPEKQRCPTAVFWLGWGPGIAVMSPCTPAHPPKWVRCAPRGIYISPTLQSLRLLLSWGKSALNQERTRMQCLTLLFICVGDFWKGPPRPKLTPPPLATNIESSKEKTYLVPVYCSGPKVSPLAGS